MAAHARMEPVLDGLAGLDPDASIWSRRFAALCALVESHMDEEETEIFPQAERVLTSAQSAELERAFLCEKRAEMRRLTNDRTRMLRRQT